MNATKKNTAQAPLRRKTLRQQLAADPENLIDGQFRIQYGALCYRWAPETDEIEVLLITSRDTGRWVIPKGWPMKKKKPYQAAETEALEEAGIRGRARKKPVGRYTYLKWLDNGDVAPCTVEVFEMRVTGIAKEFKERGQRELVWVSPDEASTRVRELELKSLLVEFRPKG
jgi:8-oxo-dGTP pyrophosphatase MutT (NUDIX family)